MENVVYVGIGKVFNEADEQRKFLEEYLNVYCLGIMDNNSNIWGKEISGKKIMKPYKIDNCDYYVVSTPKYYEEIREQLHKLYKIELDKIVEFYDFFRSRYARFQYEKKLKKIKDEKKVFSTKNIIVYTSIIGDYDILKDPLFISENIEYICITDNRNIKSNIWKIIYIEKNKDMDNVHFARYIKLFPHKFLKKNGTSIWVDAKYQIKGDLRKYIEIYGGSKKILCFPHPERDCIFQEGKVCVEVKKAKFEIVNQQLLFYESEGYSLHNGLYETGCIVRIHEDKEVQTLMSKWWEEIEKFTHRDQISFPYVCHKLNIIPDICDLDINSNYWLQVYEHKSN